MLKVKEFAELKALIFQSDEAVTKYKAKEQEFVQLQRRYTSLEEHFNQLKTLVNERPRQYDEAQKELNLLRQSNANKDSIITQRDSQISELQAKLHEQNVAVTSLNQLCQEKEEHLAELKDKLSETTETLKTTRKQAKHGKADQATAYRSRLARLAGYSSAFHKVISGQDKLFKDFCSLVQSTEDYSSATLTDDVDKLIDEIQSKIEQFQQRDCLSVVEKVATSATETSMVSPATSSDSVVVSSVISNESVSISSFLGSSAVSTAVEDSPDQHNVVSPGRRASSSNVGGNSMETFLRNQARMKLISPIKRSRFQTTTEPAKSPAKPSEPESTARPLSRILPCRPLSDDGKHDEEVLNSVGSNDLAPTVPVDAAANKHGSDANEPDLSEPTTRTSRLSSDRLPEAVDVSSIFTEHLPNFLPRKRRIPHFGDDEDESTRNTPAKRFVKRSSVTSMWAEMADDDRRSMGVGEKRKCLDHGPNSNDLKPAKKVKIDNNDSPTGDVSSRDTDQSSLWTAVRSAVVDGCNEKLLNNLDTTAARLERLADCGEMAEQILLLLRSVTEHEDMVSLSRCVWKCTVFAGMKRWLNGLDAFQPEHLSWWQNRLNGLATKLPIKVLCSFSSPTGAADVVAAFKLGSLVEDVVNECSTDALATPVDYVLAFYLLALFTKMETKTDRLELVESFFSVVLNQLKSLPAVVDPNDGDSQRALATFRVMALICRLMKQPDRLRTIIVDLCMMGAGPRLHVFISSLLVWSRPFRVRLHRVKGYLRPVAESVSESADMIAGSQLNPVSVAIVLAVSFGLSDGIFEKIRGVFRGLLGPTGLQEFHWEIRNNPRLSMGALALDYADYYLRHTFSRYGALRRELLVAIELLCCYLRFKRFTLPRLISSKVWSGVPGLLDEAGKWTPDKTDSVDGPRFALERLRQIVALVARVCSTAASPLLDPGKGMSYCPTVRQAISLLCDLLKDDRFCEPQLRLESLYCLVDLAPLAPELVSEVCLLWWNKERSLALREEFRPVFEKLRQRFDQPSLDS